MILTPSGGHPVVGGHGSVARATAILGGVQVNRTTTTLGSGRMMGKTAWKPIAGEEETHRMSGMTTPAIETHATSARRAPKVSEESDSSSQ